MGRHYYTVAEAADEALTAQITANDRIIGLDDELYEKGQSGTWTLREAVVDILGGAAVLDMSDEVGRPYRRPLHPSGDQKAGSAASGGPGRPAAPAG